jgi:hypothetical protein
VFAVESIYDVAVRNLLSEESCLKFFAEFLLEAAEEAMEP